MWFIKIFPLIYYDNANAWLIHWFEKEKYVFPIHTIKPVGTVDDLGLLFIASEEFKMLWSQTSVRFQRAVLMTGHGIDLIRFLSTSSHILSACINCYFSFAFIFLSFYLWCVRGYDFTISECAIYMYWEKKWNFHSFRILSRAGRPQILSAQRRKNQALVAAKRIIHLYCIIIKSTCR